MIIISIRDFATLHSKLFWKDKHRATSLAKIERFAYFNNDPRREHSMEKLKRGTHRREAVCMADITALDIYAFVDHLEHCELNRRTGKLGLSNATINRYISCISKVLTMAVEFNVIDAAPKVRYKKESKGRPRYFSQTEIEKLKMFYRDSKFPHMEHFIELALTTGMRKAELLGINQTAESLPDDFKTYGVVSEDGDSVTLRETKTGEPRKVMLSKRARAALKKLGGRPMDSYDHHHFYQHWDAGRRAVAPNDSDFVFHVCRHTFATRLANDMNINIAVIGEVLGHQSISTTQKYIHATPTHLAAIMEAV